MEEIKSSINNNVAVIKEAVALLPEDMPEQNRELWQKIPAQVETALGLIEDEDPDTERKLYCIEDATSKYANQITFYLFRQNLLTDELTKSFRELRTPEQTIPDLAEQEKKIKAEEDALLAQRDALIKRQDSYDLIQAILGGMSKEDAEKRIEAEKQRGAQALQARG